MKNNFFIVLGFSMIVFGLGMFVGVLLVFVSSPMDFFSEGIYSGMYLENYNYSEVEDFRFNTDGDWVCVNVDGRSFESAFEVCKHEVGHEIFANFCEDNLTKCIDVKKENE